MTAEHLLMETDNAESEVRELLEGDACGQGGILRPGLPLQDAEVVRVQ